MRTNVIPHRTRESCSGAWTLVEAVIAVGLLSFSLVSLYTGLAQGFGYLRETRESLRATQILQGKMEALRLYTWSQVNGGVFPLSFTNYTRPNMTQASDRGVTYVGSVTITDPPIPESYSHDLKEVTIRLDWISDSRPHHKQLTTFVSHYGMQNYIYTQK